MSQPTLPTTSDQICQLSDIIPVLTKAILDTKTDVKRLPANSSPRLPASPVEDVPKTIQLLSAPAFVSELDAPALSLMVSLPSCGLTECLTVTKSKVAVIINDVSELISESVANPAARGVAIKGIVIFRQVSKLLGSEDGSNPLSKAADSITLAASITALHMKAGANPIPKAAHPAIQYAARLAVHPLGARNFDVSALEGALVPYFELVTASPDLASIARELLFRSTNETDGDDNANKEDNESKDPCNCQFPLTSGAKILLNAANLCLKRGHRYSLYGRNGSGKSMLMCAVINDQVEGFSSPEVRTFYPEHDIDGLHANTTVLQFILQDKHVLCDQMEVIETLESLGFNDERQGHAIGSRSGGWKMKLATARAMLLKADILLLDEPTNHLDVVDIAWLENYLTSLKTCTSIIVSHDAGFLNNPITDVLHLNRFKIKRYRGNLEAFVKAVPEAKSYYTLEAAEDYKFKLLDPPLLEGDQTKEKSLLKMRKVGFQYPTQQVQQLYDITLHVSLSSHVAVLSPNGSGKSTLVKLLIDDMEPNKGGEVWKHPNLVIGYVAQHAFHHIDRHLDKPPLEYMLWCYQTEDEGRRCGRRRGRQASD
ncbi:translational elongation factor EF-1 alpha [Ceratobasidium sp. UAMH 11750]|nr:translational elongation factor EF-1 alpha [Ceratobasidium sp. UAMH 11750]